MNSAKVCAGDTPAEAGVLMTPSLGPVLFSDWPAHFRYPLLDPKGPRNAKKPDMFMRKNGAPPDFVLYSENHYYGTPEIDFWQFSNEIFYLGLEFFTGLLPYI